MFEHGAFLRGMNVGGHRLTNAELSSHIEALGFSDVQTFRASGNVLFNGGRKSDERLAADIERGLLAALGYAVPTFIRNRRELLALAEAEPFELSSSAGKLQVALLSAKAPPAARKRVLALADERDQLAFGERELFWLPEGGMSDSELDWKTIAGELGPVTVRTKGTLKQIATMYLGA
jgi:uncharacterized protein (DUF1697 family)